MFKFASHVALVRFKSNRPSSLILLLYVAYVQGSAYKKEMVTKSYTTSNLADMYGCAGGKSGRLCFRQFSLE